MKPDVLILDEPTRGIDVSAKSEVHEIIGEMVANGAAVIMISSEFDEVMGMSDRIYVMSEGHISAEFEAEGLTQDQILKAAMPKTKE